MPPQPSLPLRDGRLGVSSLNASHQNEPYYSNEDIQLLHEIVAEAEALYPTLPERDRLPTNALFQAAEQILPLHGHDPEHAPPNISRLIFRVGGLRSEGSLMQKFKSVLGSMGIQLEIFESSQPTSSSSLRSASIRSSAGSPDRTGTFPISPHYHGRRRRNSDSVGTFIFDHPQGVPTLSNRARSVSPTGSRYPGEELPRIAGVGGFDQTPFPHAWARRSNPHGLGGDLEDEETGEFFTRDVSIFTDRTPSQEHEPAGYLPQDSQDIPRYPLRHHEPTPPTTGRDLLDFENIEQLPASRTEEGSDRFHGASDTTAQTSDDRPPYPLQDDEAYATTLEGKVQGFRRKHQKSESTRAIGAWRLMAHREAQDIRLMESAAVQVDRHSTLLEAVEIWRENSIIEREDRLAAVGPYLDPAKQAKMERRAERAHSILLLHKAFTHWVACTRDETERTAVARRHILRKRCFSAWRSQQSADEAKMRNFRLQGILRLWSRSCIHHEVRAEVALQKYHDDLAKAVFETWRGEYMARLADELRTCRIKERCVAIWQSKLREATALYSSCALYDERLLLDDTLATWQAEYEESRMLAHGCIQQKLALDCQRILNEWRTQATLRKLLGSFTETQNYRTKQHTVGLWASSTSHASQKALTAKKVVLQDLITHWKDETKLKAFENSINEQRKSQVIYQWILQHKLASFKRSSEQRAKVQTLTSLRAVFNEAKIRSNRGLEVSDYFAVRTVQASVIGKWWASLEANRRHQRHAVALSFYNTASQSLDLWLSRQADASARTSRFEERASSGAYYCTTSNALAMWSSTAEIASRERLTRTYHAAKRQYKVNLATKYLSKWRKASGDVLALGWYAEQVCANQRTAKLGEYTQHWNACAKRVQAVREVAAGAELEVWWGRWSVSAAQQRDYELDAAEYSSVQTLARCWKSWDFAALQCKGRRNTVATIRQKNDQRLRRQVLSIWSQEAGLDRTALEMRASSTSKRSSRLGSARLGSRFHAPETPRLGRTLDHPAQSPFQQLSYIPEGDERKASDRRFVPPLHPYGLGSEQLQDQHAPASRALSQSVPRRPNRQSVHNDDARTTGPHHFRSEGPTSKPLVSFPGAYVTRGLYGSSINPPGQSLDYLGTPRAPAQGFRSPSQLGPMSDFDEESFSPDEINDPPFMSTPSRWAGSTRQQGHHPTMTPSAILSTPYERALRDEYGGIGTFPAPKRMIGRTAAKETPRVTFAGIREDSAEYEEGPAGYGEQPEEV